MAYSRYYRYKLSDRQKQLYDVLLQKILDRRQEIRTPAYSAEDVRKVLYALNFDHPALYYVDFYGIRAGLSASFCRFTVPYLCDEAQQRDLDRRLNEIADRLRKDVAGKTERAAALLMHDRLVSSCTYGECGDFPNASHSIIGPLLYSRCVCEGYAKTYKFLADAIRLRAVVVTGKGIHPDGTNEGHAWNIVRIKDGFYHVDVTFDLLFAGRYCSRAYFMLSEKEILLDHSINGLFEMPACETSGSLLKTVSGTSELLAFLSSEYRKRVTHSEVRLTKGFEHKKLMDMICDKLSPEDTRWYRQILSFWYGDYCRTLFICWN